MPVPRRMGVPPMKYVIELPAQNTKHRRAPAWGENSLALAATLAARKALHSRRVKSLVQSRPQTRQLALAIGIRRDIFQLERVPLEIEE